MTFAKPVRGSHIHMLGVAYKRDIDDVRESPALDIILLLQRLGANVTFSDPFVRSIDVNGIVMEADDINHAVPSADCVVIVTDHSKVDYAGVVRNSKLIFDTRNALKSFQSSKIIRF